MSECFENQAAVLVVLRSNLGNDDEILLTKRSHHLAQHRSEIAFPGGKWEYGDGCLQQTALRESFEEVGLGAKHVHVVGSLPMDRTRVGVKVKPYVARTEHDSLNVNPGEIAETFWVPVSFFLQDERLRTDVFNYRGREIWAPAYRFGAHTIWGLTARVIVSYLENFCGAQIPRQHSAPERIFGS